MSSIAHFSESVLIALHSLVIIAQNAPRAINSKNMANILDASENTMAKVMQRLVKVNLIQSTRGPQGGFTLAAPAQDISLLQIFEAIEGNLRPTTCPFNKNACPFKECLFGNFNTEVNEKFKNQFGKMTLDKYMTMDSNE